MGWPLPAFPRFPQRGIDQPLRRAQAEMPQADGRATGLATRIIKSFMRRGLSATATQKMLYFRATPLGSPLLRVFDATMVDGREALHQALLHRFELFKREPALIKLPIVEPLLG